MHIGIVGPCSSGPLADHLPGYGGVDLGWGGYPIVELVRALIGRGHYVSVVTLSPDLSTPRILKGPSLTYYVYPTRLKRKMRDLFKAEREYLREGILLAKPDILHAHWTYEFALACLETRLPMVVTTHDNAFQQLRFSKDLYRLGRLYIQMEVIRRAKFLTAVAPYLADSLHWLAKTEIEVIPNAINFIQSNGIEHAAESRTLKIATVLNGWGNRKNPKAAIKAFNLVQRELPDAKMLMFGDGYEEGGAADQWSRSKDLSQNIHFRGALPNQQLLTELRQVSILLHPAVEEACPMAVLEGMALGLPVVAGRASGGVPWLLDNGSAGFLTDVTNPKAIAQTLFMCIRQREDRDRKRKNAYRRLEQVFSPAAVAQQYERVYERALTASV